MDPAQRARRIALIICAVAAIVVAAYLLQHHDRVPDAGQVPSIPNLSTSSAAAPVSSTAPTSLSPSHSPSPTAAGPQLTAAFIGDDWTVGVGACNPAHRFTTRVCAALNLREVNVGVAGAGYAQRSAGHAAYASEVAPAVRAHPDLVVVSGGRNDNWDDPTTDAAAAGGLFRALRDQLPHALIVAVAPTWGDSATTVAMVVLGRAVQRAVTAVHGTYLPISDPIRGHPNEMASLADPNDAGYAALATTLIQALRRLVP